MPSHTGIFANLAQSASTGVIKGLELARIRNERRRTNRQLTLQNAELTGFQNDLAQIQLVNPDGSPRDSNLINEDRNRLFADIVASPNITDESRNQFNAAFRTLVTQSGRTQPRQRGSVSQTATNLIGSSGGTQAASAQIQTPVDLGLPDVATAQPAAVPPQGATELVRNAVTSTLLPGDLVPAPTRRDQLSLRQQAPINRDPATPSRLSNVVRQIGEALIPSAEGAVTRENFRERLNEVLTAPTRTTASVTADSTLSTDLQTVLASANPQLIQIVLNTIADNGFDPATITRAQIFSLPALNAAQRDSTFNR